MSTFKPKEVVSILKKLGLLKKDKPEVIWFCIILNLKKIIPVPIHNKDLKTGTLRSIIKQAESTEEAFLKLK